MTILAMTFCTDLYLLPSGAFDRSASSAHAAPDRRLTTAEIAARFWCRAFACAAYRSRQTHARRSTRSVRGSAGAELSARLANVLQVIYLIFNEGYSATAVTTGTAPHSRRRAPPGPHPRELAPDEQEVHGWWVDGNSSQPTRARVNPATGEPILMLDQNRALWDQLLIHRGLSALAAPKN